MKISISDRVILDASAQISVERLNESKYLVLESYFSNFNLDGFKSLMRHQADGEAKHTRMIIDFLDDRNANYIVETLAYKPDVIATIGDALNFWLVTEQGTTDLLIGRQNVATNKQTIKSLGDSGRP